MHVFYFMAYILIVSSLKNHFFVEITKLFISNSVKYICEIFYIFVKLYVPEMELLTPCFVLGECFCTQWLSQGEGFCPLRVVSEGLYRGMVEDETDSCIHRMCIFLWKRGYFKLLLDKKKVENMQMLWIYLRCTLNRVLNLILNVEFGHKSCPAWHLVKSVHDNS